jgi:hypothetical protein
VATIRIINRVHLEKQFTVLPLNAVRSCRNPEALFENRVSQKSIANLMVADL